MCGILCEEIGFAVESIDVQFVVTTRRYLSNL